MDIINEITDEYFKDVFNKLDKLILDGLELKGYNFVTKRQVMKFIKKNCKCIDDLQNQTKTYYVKDIPFLLHCYKTEINPILNTSNEISITTNLGYYKYL